jgi:tetratricopeptide (TPR) repeat protein
MEAEKLIIEAKNKESSYLHYLINKLSCSNGSFEESIAELYTDAGNLYYINKDYDNAVNAFINASRYNIKMENNIEMINCFNKIQKCFINLNNYSSAIFYIKKCSNYFFSKNKINEASKYELKIADIYEKKNDYKKAIESYKIVLSYTFDNDITINNFLLKIADLYILEYDLHNASEYYTMYLENTETDKLLRFKHPEIILKIILCHIGMKENEIEDTIISFSNNYPIFNNSIEHDFIIDFAKITEEKDISKFENLLKKYFSIKRLDNILINLFTTIKSNLEDLENIDFK